MSPSLKAVLIVRFSTPYFHILGQGNEKAPGKRRSRGSNSEKSAVQAVLRPEMADFDPKTCCLEIIKNFYCFQG
ncbi:MAG: hypothetical protein A2Y86_09320 [Candidatus Aminicenantes bacterium RBG_13_62_12]|nr:MAG: hypothetical protein A2Y86_09320 [Candidatus Aminicenantes bacterium RBG_13_62_12]